MDSGLIANIVDRLARHHETQSIIDIRAIEQTS